jgi:protein arginine N-methyltransferase 1
VTWAENDYTTVSSPDIGNRVACAANRDATVHGFFLWFDATIAPGITFSGGPDSPKMPYGCGFFPWPRPVSVQAGDAVEIDLGAKLVGDDYIWTWRTRARDMTFSQSTFLGAPLSPELLRKRAAGHAPDLNEDGRVVLRVLEGFGQRKTNAQLAEQLLAEFPGRFGSEEECLGFVGKLAGKYGR